MPIHRGTPRQMAPVLLARQMSDNALSKMLVQHLKAAAACAEELARRRALELGRDA